MTRMALKRESGAKWTRELGPWIFKKLEELKSGSMQCITMWASEMKFQIKVIFGSQFTVDLRANTCFYRYWDLTCIPCPCAIFAILVEI